MGARSYRVIGLSKFEMDGSTMLLTNESITAALQTSSLRHPKIEPHLEDVMLFSDSDDDVVDVMDLVGHSPFPSKSLCSFLCTGAALQ